MLGDFFAYFPACPEKSTWGKYWGMKVFGIFSRNRYSRLLFVFISGKKVNILV